MTRWTWLALLIGVGAAAPALAQELPRHCVVQRATQGLLHCRDGARVRLIMVDATSLQMSPLGAQADRALAELLPPGTRARLEFDVQPRDPLGNLLAYVFTPDGRMVNEELARRGFALGLIYPPNLRHADRIRAAIGLAARNRHGVWSEPVAVAAPPAAREAAATASDTAAAAPADTVAADSAGLELLEQGLRREGALAVVEGRVRNVSGAPLAGVLVVATFRGALGEPVVSETGLLVLSPVLPGQLSLFRVVTPWMPEMRSVTLRFLDAGGRPLPTRQAPGRAP